MQLISTKIDIVFKKLFGVKENKDLLISLINSIVSTEDQVADLTLLNPYNPQDKDTEISLDIKAQSHSGEKFNIEIQMIYEGSYEKMILFNWGKLYAKDIEPGYSKLEKTIAIYILNYNWFLDLEKYHNKFYITEATNNNRYFNDLELHTIELNKFSNDYKEDLSSLMAKVKNSLDLWTAFLTKHDLLRTDNDLDDKNIKKALAVLDMMGLNCKEQSICEDRAKWLSDYNSQLASAFEKGKAEGKAEGIAKGRAIVEIAINMLKQNLDIKLISAVTGLSTADISDIKSEL